MFFIVLVYQLLNGRKKRAFFFNILMDVSEQKITEQKTYKKNHGEAEDINRQIYQPLQDGQEPTTSIVIAHA
jgi:hypothetical protein